MIAYQTAAFAYQGVGQFAYQGDAAVAQAIAAARGSVEGSGGRSRRRRRSYKVHDQELIQLLPLIIDLLRRK